MSENEPPVDRRSFIRHSAVAGASLSLSAASYGRIDGANDRIGIAFLGCGGRAQAHLNVIKKMKEEGKSVACVGICDVWDGLEEDYDHEFPPGKFTRRKYLQGLYPSAKKMGLKLDDKKHVVKEYRRLLELPEVDVVCIATPDHWHARMSIDAAEAGKHIYCEKPMTKSIEEAHAVIESMVKHNIVMTVGVQSMADPEWLQANEYIRSGKIGHVAQAQTSYYRNDIRGQWRYYRLCKEMNPKTIDWKMFLGCNIKGIDGKPLAPDMTFDRSRFAQWRCHWEFGGGMFTDLLVHQTTHIIAAMGVDYPSRVVGSGGLYLEYDGRDVPDVSTIIADYGDYGCQLVITGTLISSYPIEEVIRGRMGAIRFTNKGFDLFRDDPTKGAGIPSRLGDKVLTPSEVVHLDRPRDSTYALWQNFLDCVRTRNRKTLSPAELGAAALTTIAMGVESYRSSQVVFWDKEQRKVLYGDGSWPSRFEKMSKQGGKPNQIKGWQAGDLGSDLQSPNYMKLAGPWMDGLDPSLE